MLMVGIGYIHGRAKSYSPCWPRGCSSGSMALHLAKAEDGEHPALSARTSLADIRLTKLPQCLGRPPHRLGAAQAVTSEQDKTYSCLQPKTETESRAILLLQLLKGPWPRSSVTESSTDRFAILDAPSLQKPTPNLHTVGLLL